MGHSSVRIKVRRRKVAHLAAQSRQFTVKNNTIKVADEGAIKRQGNWKIPKDGFRQPKPLMKKGWKVWFTEEYHEELGCDVYERHAERINSEYPNPQNYQKKLWKNLGKAAKMEAYTQDKLKKWEYKHPKPCQNDDLFRDEMIPAWEAEREQALEHIRDFVVSMFDKLPLIGRFKQSENKFEEKPVAEIKDVNGDGHKINEVDTSSKLIKKAQKITNKVHAKHTNLVSTNLKDHKRAKGRIILPKAA